MAHRNRPHPQRFTEKLTETERQEARRLIADRGLGRACLMLGTTSETLRKLIDGGGGGGATRGARDRIRAKLAELREPGALATGGGGGEHAVPGPAVFTMRALHVEVSGSDPKTVGEVLGAVAAAALGGGE